MSAPPTDRTGARVGVLASRVRADERRLLDAFDRRDVAWTQLDARTLSGAAGGPAPDVDVVLDREIGLARATYGASLLESQGVHVVNSSEAIRRCGDKWETTRALRDAGVPTPETTLACTPDAALDALDAMPGPAVVKPLVGSWGRRIGTLADRETAALVLEHVAALPSPQSHVVYLQELIETGTDVRVLVVGDEVVGACRREGEGLRKNEARGGFSRAYDPEPETVDAALAAARSVGATLAGVDVLVHPDRGPLVIEVNAGVEFSGLQRTVDVSVADAIVTHVLEEVPTWSPRT